MSLGSVFKLDANSQIATELEFSGDQMTPSANFGYKRKVKNYEVSNSFNTQGKLQTLFTYAHS